MITLLLIITITCHHYTKKCQNKIYWHANNIKMENNELKKVHINPICYYFSDIIKFEGFDFDILIDEKSANTLIYDIQNFD